MNPEFRLYFRLQKCRQTWFALALCSVIGSGLGVLFAAAIGDPYFLMMRRAATHSVSIVGSVVTAVIPFLISLYFLTHSKPWLIYCILTLQFAAAASVSTAVCEAFGSAGWLIHFMLQFPAICTMPLMIYMALYRLDSRIHPRLTIYSILIVCFIGMVNYFWISPFLADLMNTYETMERYALYAGLDRCL